MAKESSRSTTNLTVDDSVVTTKIPKKRYVILALVIGFLAAGTIAFMITTIVFVVNNGSQPCLSEQCVKSASVYLSTMDPEKEPCENFFEYACGGWRKQRIVPAYSRSISTFSLLQDDLSIKLKGLIERKPEINEPAPFKKARDYYKSCLDLETITSLGNASLTQLLDTVGGWPVLGNNPGGNWDLNTSEFESLWSTLSGQYAVDGVISISAGINNKNSNKYILKIDQPTFLVPGYENRHVRQGPPAVSLVRAYKDYAVIDNDPYPEEYGHKMLMSEEFSEERETYLKYMVDIVVALGGNERTATEDMRKVMEFEIEMEKFKVPASERRDPEAVYNPTTLGELGTSYPDINWARLFQLIIPASVDPPVTMSEPIINNSPAYFEKMTPWFKTQNQRVITNYMVWRLVSVMVPSLGEPFIDIRQKYLNFLQGNLAVNDRWEQCVYRTNSVLTYVTGRMYVDEYFPENAKETVLEMVSNLQKAFKSMLNDNDWMEKADKKEAIAKAEKMRIDIGFPDWLTTDFYLEQVYDDLAIQNDTFFNNTLNYFKLRAGLSHLRRRVSQTAWASGPATVNAFFIPYQNSIQFPAGILQPPFYNYGTPWFSNYGGIGTVIGHEITHGFDNTGRKYDKDGNLRTWWTQSSIDKFLDRAQCVVDQYSGYTMPENGRNIDGNQTLGENIADIGGLKESYKAYKDNIPQQQQLPGLDLTEDQMFFLSYSQVWCILSTPEWVDAALDIDVHSPGRYRVIGGLQNNEDFANAFNCPAGSYMNPAKKCNVW